MRSARGQLTVFNKKLLKGDKNDEQKKICRIVFGRIHVSGCNDAFPRM
jgi:hypothetical protein